MHFIFPKIYIFKRKLFGIIDYSTAIVDIFLGIILFSITNILFTNITFKIYFFISLYIPILLFSFLGIQKECFLNVLLYMVKFFKNQNVYLYIKNSKEYSKSFLSILHSENKNKLNTYKL